MNKFFNKIIGASLAIAMMVGVGVSVASNKKITEVNAATVTGTFEKYSGAISEGDYVVAYSTYTMGNTISSNRLTNGRTNLAANTESITNPDEKEVWHIAANGNYWTIYNEAVSKYAGSTGSKNQAALISEVNDNSKWTVTGTSTYDFENLARSTSSSNSGNKWLRNNTSNGWACYATGTGGALTLFKKASSSAQINSVEASIKTGTYYVGSKLEASDFNVTVKWTEGKEDTHPTSNFTWTVDGVADGTLKQGDNSVIVTFGGVASDAFNVIGTSLSATNIDIAESQVTIDSIGEAKTLECTVTPSNTTDAITWSSDDEEVATVDQDGKVTGVASGTTTITATAGSVSDTCTVTVNNNSKLTIDFTQKDYSANKPANAQSEPTVAKVGNYNFNFLNSYNVKDQNTTYNYVMLATKDLSTSNTLISNNTAIPGAITKIIFTTREESSTKAIYKAALSNSEIVTPITDDTNSLTGPGSITITADASANYHFFGISNTTTAGNGQINSITIFYVPSTIKEDIKALNTQTSLAYNYHKDDQGNFTYSDMSIRFGGSVAKTVWNELNTLYGITGFGVMITDGDIIKDFESFDDYADIAESSNVTTDVTKEVVDYFVPVANMGSTIGDDGKGNYFWNLRWSVDFSDIDWVFSAAAYIKIGDEYVFLKKERTCVTYLAIDYMNNRGCTASTADGSLQNIIDSSAQE